MHRSESFHAANVARLERGSRAGGQLRLRPVEALDEDAGRHLRACCRDYEASRLLLAALGRRHGPLE
jgi:hypothetical protein